MKDFDFDLNPAAAGPAEGTPVSTGNPCPGCGHTDWCFHVSETKFVCGRIDQPPNGYERQGTAGDGRGIFSKIGSPRPERNGHRPTLADRLLPIHWQPKTDSPQWQPTGQKDSKCFEQVIEYLYTDPVTGEPVGKVVRKQWSDRRAVYGVKGQSKQTKHIRPWHLAQPTPAMMADGVSDWWSEGKGCHSWPLYRQDEAVAAKLLFIVAGEQAVETARTLGLTATCQQGGEKSIKPLITFLKKHRPEQVVIWPDHDHTGSDTADSLKAACDRAGIKTVILDPSNIWTEIPQKGDIHDLVEKSGLSTEVIRQEIEAELRRCLQSLDAKISEVQFLKPHFESNPESGLERVKYDDDGNETRIKIGSHLEAIAYAQSPTGEGSSLYLQFKCLQGQLRSWLMPRSLLAGDGTELIAELLSRGYYLHRNQKSEVLDYLNDLGASVQDKFTLTDKTGWAGNSFVLPHQTIGDLFLRYGNIEPPPDHPYQSSGTHQDWIINIGQYLKGNSLLIVACCAMLSGPLLQLLKAESGGLHFFGPTSFGKTTLLFVCASLVGKPTDVIHSWRATDNGLEGIAAQHNHCTLVLDEVGQCPAKVVSQVAYMLANGQGKVRANRQGKANPSKSWELLFLSTGEVDFGGYLKQGGLTPKGGQENRILDIPATCQFGIFEKLHGFQAGSKLSNQLKQASCQYYGTGLNLFLKQLVKDVAKPDFIAELRQSLNQYHTSLSEGLSATADPAVGRVIERLAILALAGDLACRYGVLPLTQADCISSAQKVLKAWITHRGGTGSHDLKQALEHVQHLLTSNLYSDRVRDVDAGKETITRNLLAYKKTDAATNEIELWVPPTVFRQEFVSGGVDIKTLVMELQRKGWLLGPDSGGKSTHQRWVSGEGNKRFYIFIRPGKEQEVNKDA